MTLAETKVAMIKGHPVVWNGGGTAVQSNVSYSYIVFVGEKYDRSNKKLLEIAQLQDKNKNSSLLALVEDLRPATNEEVLKFHGFKN